MSLRSSGICRERSFYKRSDAPVTSKQRKIRQIRGGGLARSVKVDWRGVPVQAPSSGNAGSDRASICGRLVAHALRLRTCRCVDPLGETARSDVRRD